MRSIVLIVVTLMTANTAQAFDDNSWMPWNQVKKRRQVRKKRTPRSQPSTARKPSRSNSWSTYLVNPEPPKYRKPALPATPPLPTRKPKGSLEQTQRPVGKVQRPKVRTVENSGSTKRPPQFVLLAFDGSKSHKMWRETLEFAKNEGIKFTYFISGVYFVPKAKRRMYIEPSRGAGRSAIGWGGTEDDIASRVDYVRRAYNAGHEIASHANGHFNGNRYSSSQWNSEFSQFDSILKGSWKYTGTQTPKGWLNLVNDVIGFRAPQLGHSKGLWPAMRNHRFKYDTSRIRRMDYWPQRLNGIWDFPLAGLKIAETGQRTASMDYNFYMADSKAKRGPSSMFKTYENRMLTTYMKYFKRNYYGNRAPIDIGHHFSMWNGGAYWKAMKRFTRAVCGQPEVVCGTYTELTKFMEDTPSSTLAAYSRGRFPKMPQGSLNLPPSLQRVSIQDQNWGELNNSEMGEVRLQMQDHWKAHEDDGNENVREWADDEYSI